MNTQHPMGFKARQACLGGKPKVTGHFIDGKWLWQCSFEKIGLWGYTPKEATQRFYDYHNGFRG